MGFLRRDRRTLNERLIDDLESESEVRAIETEETETVEAEPGPVEPRAYWDAVVEAVDGELLEDSYEFASLATGDLVVEENVEESLSSLADAVDSVLDAPYRAVAVRHGPEWWSISARCIRVVPLGLRGERARLVSAGGRLELEIDGQPAADATALAQLAAEASHLGVDYVVDATYLDGGLWEVTALPTGG
jgi:hypothetical protein